MRHRPTRLSTALDPLFLGCLDAVRTFLYATRIDRDTSHHAISALPPLYRRDYASLAGLGGYLPYYFERVLAASVGPERRWPKSYLSKVLNVQGN